MKQVAPINEIFLSLSGEGVSMGVPTLFIRLAGCSLRCGKVKGKKPWCDTKYALSERSGKKMEISTVLEKIQEQEGKFSQILITGGEPLEGDKRDFCQELAKILSKMRHNQKMAYPRIETNGKESIQNLKNMVFSLDYKLPGSGMEKFMNLKNLEIIQDRKNPLDEIKFIIRDRVDYLRACEVIDQFSLTGNLILNPVHTELPPTKLASWILEEGPSFARLGIQLHKTLWGNRRGV